MNPKVGALWLSGIFLSVCVSTHRCPLSVSSAIRCRQAWFISCYTGSLCHLILARGPPGSGVWVYALDSVALRLSLLMPQGPCIVTLHRAPCSPHCHPSRHGPFRVQRPGGTHCVFWSVVVLGSWKGRTACFE